MPAAWPTMIKAAELLPRESAGWPRYGVVTTASPWKVAEPMLAREPGSVAAVQSLERTQLEEVAAALRGVELVVGLGGGLAMDGAKFAAWRTGAPLVQVPSTASNNACFTRGCGCTVHGRRAPVREGPLPERILVDFTLIAQAPARLNRAGVGDILCSQSSLADWELAYRAGRDVDWDEAVRDRTLVELDRLAEIAPGLGANDLGAYSTLFDIGERIGRDIEDHPRARLNSASEHLLGWWLEQRSGRRLIHGEIVSLGTILMAHIQGNAPERAARVVRDARCAFRPGDIGTTWEQIEDAVLTLPEYARDVLPWYTVVDELTAGPGSDTSRLKAAFDDARAYVESLG
jgi:glycerol-1-phosphate dehydrogenase [NAD(P)+]